MQRRFPCNRSARMPYRGAAKLQSRCDLYLLVYLDEGKVQSRVVAQHDWDRAKTAIDRHHAALAGQ
jgi:hypothetical protein